MTVTQKSVSTSGYNKVSEMFDSHEHPKPTPKCLRAKLCLLVVPQRHGRMAAIWVQAKSCGEPVYKNKSFSLTVG